MDMEELAQRRRQYETAGFDVAEADPDPFRQFTIWFEAVVPELPEPNVMALATAAADGTPSVRNVLLKGFDAGGFVFYTNRTSAKARDLAANPKAELLFTWLVHHRQVRVLGAVEPVSAQESDEYFATRPRGSQIGAWASAQSSVVADRAMLEQAFADVEARYPGAVPRPLHWGGYRVVPTVWEFWQGRSSRMHDRIRYRRSDATTPGEWIIDRLAP